MLVHIRGRPIEGSTSWIFENRICYAGFSEVKAQAAFNKGEPWYGPWDLNLIQLRHRYCKAKGKEPRNVSYALLLSCRQVYHEARHILYARNTLSVCTFGVLKEIVSRLPQSQVAKIRALHIDIDHFRLREWDEILEIIVNKFQGLRHIHLDLNVGLDAYNNRIKASYFRKLAGLLLKSATVIVRDERSHQDRFEKAYIEEQIGLSKAVRKAILGPAPSRSELQESIEEWQGSEGEPERPPSERQLEMSSDDDWLSDEFPECDPEFNEVWP